MSPQQWMKQVKRELKRDWKYNQGLVKAYADLYADIGMTPNDPDERSKHLAACARMGRILPNLKCDLKIRMVQDVIASLELTATMTTADYLMQIMFGERISQAALKTAFAKAQRTAAEKYTADNKVRIHRYARSLRATYCSAPRGALSDGILLTEHYLSRLDQYPLYGYRVAYDAFCQSIDERAFWIREMIKQPEHFAKVQQCRQSSPPPA